MVAGSFLFFFFEFESLVESFEVSTGMTSFEQFNR